jgi:hypothetical protein
VSSVESREAGSGHGGAALAGAAWQADVHGLTQRRGILGNATHGDGDGALPPLHLHLVTGPHEDRRAD